MSIKNCSEQIEKIFELDSISELVQLIEYFDQELGCPTLLMDWLTHRPLAVILGLISVWIMFRRKRQMTEVTCKS